MSAPGILERDGYRNLDAELNEERHLIECFFNKIKHFCRIALRFERSATLFASFFTIAYIIVWLAQMKAIPIPCFNGAITSRS